MNGEVAQEPETDHEDSVPGDLDSDSVDDGGSSRRSEGIEFVMDRLVDQTEGHQEVQLKDILTAFDGRLFGPAILLPAVIAVTPLGAIPVVPTLIGCFIVLIAGQQLFGLKRPWIPKIMRERGVSRDKMVGAFEKFRPWAKRIDRLSHPRLSLLVEGPMTYVIAADVVILGGMMPPLELIPFAVFLPASAVLLFGLALVGRDGAIALFGLTLSLVSAVALIYWLVT